MATEKSLAKSMFGSRRMAFLGMKRRTSSEKPVALLSASMPMASPESAAEKVLCCRFWETKPKVSKNPRSASASAGSLLSATWGSPGVPKACSRTLYSLTWALAWKSKLGRMRCRSVKVNTPCSIWNSFPRKVAAPCTVLTLPKRPSDREVPVTRRSPLRSVRARLFSTRTPRERWTSRSKCTSTGLFVSTRGAGGRREKSSSDRSMSPAWGGLKLPLCPQAVRRAIRTNTLAQRRATR